MMKRLCVVCEGQTEEEFVLKVLAPAFYGLGLNLIPEMIETSQGHKGGALRYDRVKRHLRNALRQHSAPVVTTLFDLYRLDSGFPGFDASQDQANLSQRLSVLTRALHADVVAEAGCQPDRFIAYIQAYEFEALLFSDVPTLTSMEPAWQHARAALEAARAPSQIQPIPSTSSMVNRPAA
jgi:hypothetical protein